MALEEVRATGAGERIAPLGFVGEAKEPIERHRQLVEKCVADRKKEQEA